MNKFDLTKIKSIEVEGIDHSDTPDFVDAFISYAEYNGEKLTDSELEILNQDSSFVYQCVIDRIF